MMKLKILLVEDSPDFAALLKKNFPKTGFDGEFKHLTSGESVLAYLASIQEGVSDSDPFGSPNLMITDLGLPGIPGFEVIKTIRQHPKLNKIPIIVMTATDKKEDCPHSYTEGATVFLRKDDSIETLKDIIAHLFVTNRIN